MKLSEHIAALQKLYDKYGDGIIYTLDDCATQKAIGIEEYIEYDYQFDPQTWEETRSIKKAEYRLYSYGYSY